MTEPSPELVVGDVGSLDLENRLVIPADVRKAPNWLPRKGAKPFDLIADLRDIGLVRFFPAASARPRINALKQQLRIGHPDHWQALAALADRYREATYYASDTRVHCGTMIAWHLRSTSHLPDQFYVEALDQFIDVMTMER